MSPQLRVVWMDVTLWVDRAGHTQMELGPRLLLQDGSVLWVTSTPWHGLADEDAGQINLFDRAETASALSGQLVPRAVHELTTWLATGGLTASGQSDASPLHAQVRLPSRPQPVVLWLHVWNTGVIRQLVCSQVPWQIRHWAGALFEVRALRSARSGHDTQAVPLDGMNVAVERDDG